MATITTNWSLDGLVHEQRYYRSSSPIDTNSPPSPVELLGNTDRFYVDTVPAKTKQYIAVSSVRNGIEKFSDIKLIGDQHWDNVVFYARFNNSASDISPKANTATLGSGVTYRDVGAKFGQALYAYNSATHCISYPLTHMGFAAGEDFTIEAWCYCTLKPTGLWHSPFGTWSSSAGWCFFFTPTGVSFNFSAGGLGANFAYNLNTIISICVSRKDGVVRLFFNGTIVATITDNSAITAKPLRVGGNQTTTDWWRGCIDELRITKGVARYTENYTPQSKQFFDF